MPCAAWRVPASSSASCPRAELAARAKLLTDAYELNDAATVAAVSTDRRFVRMVKVRTWAE